MHDAYVESWIRESNVPPALLGSMRELNCRFLELLARAPAPWGISMRAFHPEVSARVAPLSAVQKSAAANCPYALFDLRFHDEGHWSMRLPRARCAADAVSVAEGAGVDAATLDFVRLALFFAWHLASTANFAAQLLLGMNAATAAAFRAVTIDCLPLLAATEADNLTARWSGCAAYWSALTGAASQADSAQLRRIQLQGLQLAAAVRLAQGR